MKKFLNRILVIFLIFVLLYVTYSKYIRKDKITTVFGYGFLVVLTGSMEPEIEKGSLIIIKNSKDYNVRRCYYLWGGQKLFCNT